MKKLKTIESDAKNLANELIINEHPLSVCLFLATLNESMKDYVIDNSRKLINDLGFEEETEQYKLLVEANDVLRSCFAITERNGKDTNWNAINKRLRTVLEKQHSFLWKEAQKKEHGI